MFRYHPNLGKNRDKIGVAGPPRDDMKMEVAFHPGPGDHPQVKADVEAVRVHDPLQDGDGHPDLVHEVQGLLRGQVVQPGKVAPGGNQQMAVDIGILVHHDAGKLAIEQHQALRQVLPRFGAENAARRLIFPQDIFHPPRGPQHFHAGPHRFIDDPWLPISMKYSMIRDRFKGFYKEERTDSPGKDPSGASQGPFLGRRTHPTGEN